MGVSRLYPERGKAHTPHLHTIPIRLVLFVFAIWCGLAPSGALALNSAVFVKLDSTTFGNWQSSYGGDGYDFVGATPSLPAYAQMTVNGASTFTWEASTNDARALEQVSGGARLPRRGTRLARSASIWT